MKFRTLKADEIEIRIGATDKKTYKWINLLLYMTARAPMDMLDETVGKTNWKRRHTRDNANCIVSIYDEEKKEWVEKEDTGSESNTEAEKGQASDSFKRACVNWGIGRELYSSPKIFLYPKSKEEYETLKYMTYKVKSITYDINNKIIGLVIVDRNGKVVFSKETTQITKAQIIRLQDLLKELGDKYKTALYKKIGIESSKELSFTKANKLIEELTVKVEEKKKKEANEDNK